jgi:hypothetical protein
MNEEILEKLGYFNLVYIKGLGWCGITKMLFTYALCVSLNEFGYMCRYCFEHEIDAVGSLNAWDGQDDAPGPWIKRKGLGEDLVNPNFGKSDA